MPTTPAVQESPLPAAGPAAIPATIRLALIGGLPATAVLLGLLAATAGLGPAGWITGLAGGAAATALIAGARLRSESPRLFPADWITLARALMAAAAAGLVADSFSRPVPVAALATLAAAALALDAVDGQVARRTGTATPLGGRLDGEVDAFLIAVLSVAVSRDYGSWVLVIGAARYALLVAGWAVRWLAAPLPPRYWRKVVAAVQGIVLTAAAAGLLSRVNGIIAVALALLLLAESFGRDVIWLCRNAAGERTRRALRVSLAVLAFVVVWADLLVPDRAWQFSGAAFARIPVEILVLVAIGLVLPGRPRKIVAGIAGALLGVLTFATMLNIAFFEFVDRSFNPVHDWADIPPALGVVRAAIGRAGTNLLLGVLAFVVVLLIVAITMSAIHVTTVAARNRRLFARALPAAAVVWGVCAVLSLQLLPGFPIASTSASGLAAAQVSATHEALTDSQHFEKLIHQSDPEASVPASSLLTGLRGKDVIFAFVESYGQGAVQGTSYSPGVDAVLSKQTAALSKAGFSAQSAWLTSPTFGGISWLAHSTLESGLWVDSPQRYSEIVASQRYTLSDAFKKAGFRTVSDELTDDEPWPPGTQFYHFDKLYNRLNVGYKGPTFSYASMPDQYGLAAFQRAELTPGHKPLMAQIVLISSHSPWAPIPKMVPWNKVGNGSIFDPMPAQGQTPLQIAGSASLQRQAYGNSIQYSVTALTSWVTQLHDPNLVLVFLGDHQPAGPVSRPGASHAVPVAIVAKDPSVFRQISSWHWTSGLRPSPTAPLEPMDDFRNQFLAAFSSASPQTAAARTGSGPASG